MWKWSSAVCRPEWPSEPVAEPKMMRYLRVSAVGEAGGKRFNSLGYASVQQKHAAHGAAGVVEDPLGRIAPVGVDADVRVLALDRLD
jgi:hypothetical protein